MIILSAFMLLITLPLLGLFFLKHKSESENRNLASMPYISMNNYVNFPKEFELFVNDHFGGRKQFLKLHKKFYNDLLGISLSKKVIHGKDGWLFYLDDYSLYDIGRVSYFSHEEKKKWGEHLLDKFLWLKKQGITYRFIVAPDKHTIYPEMLPESIKIPARLSRFDDLIDTIQPEVKDFLLDLKPSLLKYKEKNQAMIFYKNDTHWTSYGAFVTIPEIMKSIGRPFIKPNIVTIDKGQPFIGDLAKMLGLFVEESDDIPNRSSQTWYISPVISHDIYQKKSIKENSAGGFGVYETRCTNGTGTVLVMRDSFGSALQPYLSSLFSRVIYVWGRPEDDDELFIELVKKEKPDFVIEERVERSMRRVPKEKFQVYINKK